jgi:hypothetical protein
MGQTEPRKEKWGDTALTLTVVADRWNSRHGTEYLRHLHKLEEQTLWSGAANPYKERDEKNNRINIEG